MTNELFVNLEEKLPIQPPTENAMSSGMHFSAFPTYWIPA